jgi:hypothetical protein
MEGGLEETWKGQSLAWRNWREQWKTMIQGNQSPYREHSVPNPHCFTIHRDHFILHQTMATVSVQLLCCTEDFHSVMPIEQFVQLWCLTGQCMRSMQAKNNDHIFECMSYLVFPCHISHNKEHYDPSNCCVLFYDIPELVYDKETCRDSHTGSITSTAVFTTAHHCFLSWAR